MALFYSANSTIVENNISSNMFFQKNLPPSKKKASFRKKIKCPNALEQFCGEKLRWFLKHQVRKASTQHIFIEFICETRTQTVSSTKGGNAVWQIAHPFNAMLVGKSRCERKGVVEYVK